MKKNKKKKSEKIPLPKDGIPFDAQLNITKKFEDEAGNFHITGYAATSDFDLQGDVIAKEALEFSSEDLLNNSTMLFNHDDDAPIGRIVKQTLDDRGTLIDAIIEPTARIPKTGTLVVDAIKSGTLNKFSIRARVLDAVKEWVEEIGRVANVIKRMLLLECSLVSIPANPEAKAMSWYVSKALAESTQGENEDMKVKDMKKKADETDEEFEARKKVAADAEAKVAADAKELEELRKKKKDEDDEADELKKKAAAEAKKKEEDDAEELRKKNEADAAAEVKKKAEEEAEELRKKAEEDAKNNPPESRGFPTPDILKSEWFGHAESKEITRESSSEDIMASWGEFCKSKGYPEGFAYPYPEKSASDRSLEQVVLLADALSSSDNTSVSNIGDKIKSLASPLVGSKIPYPGITAAVLETDLSVEDEEMTALKAKEKAAEETQKKLEAELKEVQELKKTLESEVKTRRKGLVTKTNEGDDGDGDGDNPDSKLLKDLPKDDGLRLKSLLNITNPEDVS